MVVQAEEMLSRSVVLVAPTSRSARAASFRPEVMVAGDDTRVLVEQVGAVDVQRLGFEVFVPHEHELATGTDVTAASIFAQDRPGIERADGMLAILDGPSVDDGTACEIGMFHALMQSDPSKKGIVGLLTDMRGMRGESTGVNLFVQGAIEDAGRIVASIDEARDVLRAWRWTRPRGLVPPTISIPPSARRVA